MIIYWLVINGHDSSMILRLYDSVSCMGSPTAKPATPMPKTWEDKLVIDGFHMVIEPMDDWYGFMDYIGILDLSWRLDRQSIEIWWLIWIIMNNLN